MPYTSLPWNTAGNEASSADISQIPVKDATDLLVPTNMPASILDQADYECHQYMPQTCYPLILALQPNTSADTCHAGINFKVTRPEQ